MPRCAIIAGVIALMPEVERGHVKRFSPCAGNDIGLGSPPRGQAAAVMDGRRDNGHLGEQVAREVRSRRRR
jgi:hypothetical protein